MEMDFDENNADITNIDSYFVNVHNASIERAVDSDSLRFEGSSDQVVGLSLYGKEEEVRKDVERVHSEEEEVGTDIQEEGEEEHYEAFMEVQEVNVEDEDDKEDEDLLSSLGAEQPC